MPHTFKALENTIDHCKISCTLLENKYGCGWMRFVFFPAVRDKL